MNTRVLTFEYLTSPAFFKSNGADGVMVTPELAANWLENNRVNRHVRPQRVDEYAAMMENGEWVRNGERISFTEDGLMINGQHRLSAICKSGVTLPIDIKCGLDFEAISSIDYTIPKDLADTLTIDQVPNSKNVASIMRIWKLYSAGRLSQINQRSRAQNRISNPQALRAYHDLIHSPGLSPEVVTSAIRMANNLSKQHVCRRHRIIAFIYCMVFHEDYLDSGNHNSAEDFTTRLHDGIKERKDDPVGALRDALIRLKGTKGATDIEILAVCIKGWDKYRKGQDVRQLRFQENEKFPR